MIVSCSDLMTSFLIILARLNLIARETKQRTQAKTSLRAKTDLLKTSLGHSFLRTKSLSKFAALLKSQSRGGDIACRYGGEEFVVIMPENSLEAAMQRTELLREQVKELHVEHRGQTLGAVTTSMGLSMFPEHGDTTEELVRGADSALYKAKHEGRDRVKVAEISAP